MSTRRSPVLQLAQSLSCLNKIRQNTSDSDNSSDSRAAAADNSGGRIQETKKLTMKAFEQETTPKEKGVQATTSSPKLQSNSCSPVLRRGRNVSCLRKLQTNSNDYDSINDFAALRTPQSKRAEASGTDSRGVDEKKAFQARKLGWRGASMNRNRSISKPLLQKPESNEQPLHQADFGTDTELQENQNKGQNIVFAEIQPEFQYSMKVENAKGRNLSMADWRNLETKPPYGEVSEQTFLAPGVNSPCTLRRLSARSRTSSMPEYEKTLSNVTAFSNKPVEFREITEPLKKSKCFHTLSTIVPLSQTQFQTAILEIDIQKQQQEEKVLEEN